MGQQNTQMIQSIETNRWVTFLPRQQHHGTYTTRGCIGRKRCRAQEHAMQQDTLRLLGAASLHISIVLGLCSSNLLVAPASTHRHRYR